MTKKPPTPPSNPRGKRPKEGGGKKCPTCGSPLGEHTIKQLADCLASQN